MQGWLLEERYLDADDKPLKNHDGIHYWVIDYDADGNQARFATFGLRDEPVPGVIKACAKTVRYDARNNGVEARWFGPDGRPTLNEDGYAVLRQQFDGQNNLAGGAFFDAGDRPCLSSENFHRWTKKFDARRHPVRWDFFGTHDEPILGTGGYAAIDAECDPGGRETKRTFLGTDGKPVVVAAGYASYRQSYHPGGQLARVDYLGADGEKVLCENGFCTYYSDYDKDGLLQTRTWNGLPGLTAYQTETESYLDGWKRSERYLSAEGRVVNNAIGYAQENIDRDEAGTLLRYVYLDANGKPAYGERGFVGAEYVSKAWKYYDASGQTMQDVEHGGVRPVMYVGFLRSRDCVAAKSGLLPGDILWQMGDFSYPRVLAARWEKDDDYQTFKTHVYEAWKAALKPGQATPIRVVVIRARQVVELNLATVPAGGIGVNTNLRRLPVADYEAMASQCEQAGAPKP